MESPLPKQYRLRVEDSNPLNKTYLNEAEPEMLNLENTHTHTHTHTIIEKKI